MGGARASGGKLFEKKLGKNLQIKKVKAVAEEKVKPVLIWSELHPLSCCERI